MSFFQRHREARGAVAVLLVVILLPMMTLSAFMVDTARYNLAKSMVSSAGDLALNAALADYDTILKDVYGLFAMSQVDDIEGNVRNYFKETLTGYGVVDESGAEDYISSLLGAVYEYLVVEDKEAVNLMSMLVDDDSTVTVSKAADSGLDNPDILEKQIVEYMKYRGPVSFGLSFVDALSAFTKIEKQAEVLEAQIEAQEGLQPVSDANEALYRALKAYDEKYNALENPVEGSGLSVRLSKYGEELNLYELYYEMLNRWAITFCLAAKAGASEVTDADVLSLSGSENYVEKSGGHYSVTHHFEPFDTDDVDAGDVESLYTAAMSAVVSSAINAYDAAKFGALRATSEFVIYDDEIIPEFQQADSFYKSSSYEPFIGAAKQIDCFVQAAEAYEEVLEAAIQSINDSITEGMEAGTLTLADKAALEEDIEDYEEELEDVEDKVDQVLGGYEDALNHYNSDVYKYKKYVGVAMHCIATYALNHVAEIQDNLNNLNSLLTDITEKLVAAKEQISSYMKKVGTWETSNNTYASAETDSFSEGNKANIEEAKNSFNIADIEEMESLIATEQEKLAECIRQIENSFNFNGTHISELTNLLDNGTRILELIDGGIFGSAIRAYRVSGEVTESQCLSWFIYEGHVEEDFLDDLKHFLEPYPCCQFAHYLYQTYGRSVENFESTASEEEKVQAQSNKADYEKLKNNESNVSTESDETVSSYGYTYMAEGKAIGGEGYPSTGTAGENPVESSNKNGSEGMKENKSAASKMLSGLTEAMTTGRDKLLVTAYLFDNFSYNTLVQDLAREGGADLSWPLHCNADLYSSYENAATTSSGIPINGANNYFYGAEIEYILYGNSNASQNVAYVKASIFAIRFLFNAVFAFTDTGVRNETRVIALAVQAASLGVIPYQLVQVVLQVALAMGESAIDLKNMEAGAKVVLIKSKDTWTLSSTGMVNLAGDALKTVAESTVTKAMEALNDKLAKITDAAASELVEAVNGLSKDLGQSVNSAAEEVLNSLTLQINAAIDSAVNQAAYIADSDIAGLDGNIAEVKAYACGQVQDAIEEAKVQISSLLAVGEAEAGSVKAYVASQIRSHVGSALDDVCHTVQEKINSAPDVTEVRACMYEEVYKVKNQVSELIQGKVEEIRTGAVTAFEDKINEVSGFVTEKASEATEAAKEQILEKVNGFIDDISASSTQFISDNLSEVNHNAVTSSSKASAIRFGYSDYLKLFVFIGLCASDKSGNMLKRTADVIQANIANAGEGSDLYHRITTVADSGGFKMSNAKTYVFMQADVKLDLMFLNLGAFQAQIEAYNEELGEEYRMDLSATLDIPYIGIAGY